MAGNTTPYQRKCVLLPEILNRGGTREDWARTYTSGGHPLNVWIGCRSRRIYVQWEFFPDQTQLLEERLAQVGDFMHKYCRKSENYVV
jgi:hypothetical protein